MRCTNPFSSVAFVAIFTAACAQGDKSTLVTSEQYSATACWLGQDGSLESFLVLAKEDSTAVPYLISNKCIVNGDYSSYGEGVLHHLNAVRLVDSYGTMQHALPGITLSDSTISDQPTPYSNSGMYYLKAKVKRIPDENMIIYAPVAIHQFVDMKTSFEAFLNLSPAERQNMQVAERDSGRR